MFDGLRMAEVRKARKLTGLQLAELAQCSNVTVSRIENGHQQPSASVASRLADALDVPLAELTIDLRREAANRRLTAALGLGAPAGLSDEEMEAVVLEALRKMDPLLRAKAIGYILGLASSSSTFAAGAASRLAGSAESARRQPPPADDGEP